MANSEKREPRPQVHLLLAFRRRKDNESGPARCFREVIRDKPIDMERLLARVRTVPGIWRIHQTVNTRDVSKALRLLQHKLLDRPELAETLETEWKTCLLQKESRGSRRILLDIDEPASLRLARYITKDVLLEQTTTPSGGYHLICDTFDTRLLAEVPGVTIQHDGYVFLRQVKVTNEGTLEEVAEDGA